MSPSRIPPEDFAFSRATSGVWPLPWPRRVLAIAVDAGLCFLFGGCFGALLSECLNR